MLFTPEAYQQPAIDFIVKHPRCFLDAGIGAGKTIVALTAGHQLWASLQIETVLIISTVNVIRNTMPDEMMKWDHLRGLSYTILHGRQRDLRAQEKSVFYFTNYEGLPWLVKNPNRPKFDMIVLDESHLAKGHKTNRFKMLRFMCSHAQRVVCMTGTPIGNSLADVWAQYYFLDGGDRLFRSYYEFQRHYFRQTDYMGYKWAPFDWSRAAIIKKVADITFQVHSEEIDKPDLYERTIYVDLPEDIMEQYNKLERDFLLEVEDDEINALNTASLINKLRQLASGFLYRPGRERNSLDTVWMHQHKYDLVKKIYEASDEPMIIVAGFQADFEALRQRIPGLQCAYGRTSKIQTRNMLQQWNNREIDVLALHPKSLGTGLNLQDGGSYELWLSPDWSYLGQSQTIGRILRKGQHEDVRVDYMIARGTVDEMVYSAVQSKATTALEFARLLKIYKQEKTDGIL